MLPQAAAEEQERSAESVSEEPEHLIAFSHVGISFDGRSVLEDVSFYVNRGQTLCILGRSGVGKSVALRMLMGFLKPDEGSIRVEGQEITDLDEEGMRGIRKRVTMVFQNGALFDSLSVRENVAFPLRERGDLTEDQILELVDRLISLVGARMWWMFCRPASRPAASALWPLPAPLQPSPRSCSTTSPPPWSTPSSPATSATSSSGSSASLDSPPSWLPTTCALPSGSLTWCSSSIRAALSILDRSRALWSLLIQISNSFFPWTLTCCLRNSEFLTP